MPRRSDQRAKTVEFDVSNGEPEETHVFRLEVASDDVIEGLVRQRFPQLAESAVRRWFARRTLVRFLEGGDSRYACDHLGRLTELASLGLRRTVTDDCAMVFNPRPLPDIDG